MSRRPGHEWRYLPHGRVVHALRHPTDTHAQCGVGPVWYASDGWYGTGRQAEYERAAELPECKRCLALIPGGR